MTDGSYLGVDIGSSGTRVVALGHDGEVQAIARRGRERAPMSVSDLERDLDVETIWVDVGECISEVLAQASKPRALGVCAMRQTLILQGEDGIVLFASGNDDLRAALSGAAVDAEYGDVFASESRRRPAMIFWPGKLAWIDAQAPEVATHTSQVTTLDAWVVGRLTNSPQCMGLLSAVETGAWSVLGNRWIEAVVPDWVCPVLPAVVHDGHPAAICKSTACKLGLPESLPVAVGVPDTHAAELGSRHASLDAGDCVTAGWSLTITRPVSAWDADGTTWRGLRLGGGFLAESGAGDIASGYRWLCHGRAPEITGLANGIESAAELGVFALTGARVMDPSSAGIGAAGLVAPIPFVGGSPAPALLGTAILEDLAFAVRGNRERLPAPISDRLPVRLTGGFAAAPAAGPILANVLDVPVAVFPQLPVSAIGAAIWAAQTVGEWPEVAGSKRLGREPGLYEPDAVRARALAGHYDRWADLRARLESFMQNSL